MSIRLIGMHLLAVACLLCGSTSWAASIASAGIAL